MGLFSSLNPISAISGLLGGGGGGGGGGSSSMTSGGIGSETGNYSANNANNTTTTTTDTTNTDKRQVINSGGVGVATDSSPITITNNTSDPAGFQAMITAANAQYQTMVNAGNSQYGALLAVTDHLASGTLSLLAANMDTANQASAAALVEKTSNAATTTTTTGQTLAKLYADHKPAFLAGAALVVYFIFRKG